MRPDLFRWPTKRPALSATAILLAGLLAACGGSQGPDASTAQKVGAAPSGPITIGASLSLTGSAANDFSADGRAFERGYELWAKDVNAHGGLLGRQVKLRILNDDSSPQQVVTNYQSLIGSDHVDLVFGPFSSVLTTPASSVAARYGMAIGTLLFIAMLIFTLVVMRALRSRTT